MQDTFMPLLKAGSLAQEMQSLFERLQAYQKVKDLYNFCPSEISSFILKPTGRDSGSQRILYQTIVSLKNGTKVKLDIDIRDLLPV